MYRSRRNDWPNPARLFENVRGVSFGLILAPIGSLVEGPIFTAGFGLSLTRESTDNEVKDLTDFVGP
jgi:hypothetical protein